MQNAVIAYTHDIAKQYLHAFGLDSETWDTIGMVESPPIGRRYDTVVMIRPHWHMTAEIVVKFEEMALYWRTACRAGGKISIL
jgi:hypothetical protein